MVKPNFLLEQELFAPGNFFGAGVFVQIFLGDLELFTSNIFWNLEMELLVPINFS